MKYVLGVDRSYPTEDLFKIPDTNFHSLYFTIKMELLLLMFKVIHNKIKHNYDLLQKCDQHQYGTRQRSDYIVQHFKTDRRNQNIFHKGLIEFNNLPVSIKNLTSFAEFKFKLQVHLCSSTQ